MTDFEREMIKRDLNIEIVNEYVEKGYADIEEVILAYKYKGIMLYTAYSDNTKNRKPASQIHQGIKERVESFENSKNKKYTQYNESDLETALVYKIFTTKENSKYKDLLSNPDLFGKILKKYIEKYIKKTTKENFIDVYVHCLENFLDDMVAKRKKKG